MLILGQTVPEVVFQIVLKRYSCLSSDIATLQPLHVSPEFVISHACKHFHQ